MARRTTGVFIYGSRTKVLPRTITFLAMMNDPESDLASFGLDASDGTYHISFF
jgi:hypothetical protein